MSRRPLYRYLRYWLSSGLLTLLPLSFALAQSNYQSSELPAPEWPDQYLVVDVNGNGRQDLLLADWSTERGREIRVFLQQADGRYPAQPSRSVAIRSDVIAVMPANVRPMPGNELLLLTNNAVYSLSTAIPGYDNNLQHLFDWELAAAMPDRRRIHFLPPPTDLNGDGHIDLLLPGRQGYGLFLGDGGEGFRLHHQFETESQDLDPGEMPAPSGRFSTEITINSRDGLGVRIVPRSASLFEGFVDDRRSDGRNGALLQSRLRQPVAVSARINPQADADIVFMNVGKDFRARFNRLSINGSSPLPEQTLWQAPAHDEGEHLLMDLNGNGLDDIVRLVEESGEWQAYFYVNRNGQFDFDTPDQVMRFSGYDLRLSAIDLDGDGRPELSVSYYSIPVAANLRNPSITRSQLIFGRGSGELFNNRPDSRLDENFSASNVRALSETIHLDADINGNGRRDALYITDEGTLAARAIDDNFRLANQPFWQYVPGRTILGLRVVDLNGDGRPDFLLQHSTTTTVLVSTP
jgi:hypothetical protein